MTKLLAIIDDDPEMGELYSLILEPLVTENILELEVFQDADHFFSWLDHHSPDLVISDIHLPDRSGTEIIQELRDRGLETPAYLVSGFSSTEFEPIMKELGHCQFLSKPLDLEDFSRQIEKEIGVDNSLT